MIAETILRDLHEICARLERIETRLDLSAREGGHAVDKLHSQLTTITERLKEITHMDKQILDLLNKMDAETNAIASELDGMRNKLAAAQAPDLEIIQRMTALSTRLQSLASDPANPVPVAPPVPAPPAPAPVEPPAAG